MIKNIVKGLESLGKNEVAKYSSVDKWIELGGKRVTLAGLGVADYTMLEVLLELGVWRVENESRGVVPRVYQELEELIGARAMDGRMGMCGKIEPSEFLLAVFGEERDGIIVFRHTGRRVLAYRGLNRVLSNLVGVDRSLKAIWERVEKTLLKGGRYYNERGIAFYRELHTSRDAMVGALGFDMGYWDFFFDSIYGLGDVGINIRLDRVLVYCGEHIVRGEKLYKIRYLNLDSKTGFKWNDAFNVGNLKELPKVLGKLRCINFKEGVSGLPLDKGGVKVNKLKESRYVVVGLVRDEWCCYDIVEDKLYRMTTEQLRQRSKQVHNVYFTGEKVCTYKDAPILHLLKSGKWTLYRK